MRDLHGRPFDELLKLDGPIVNLDDPASVARLLDAGDRQVVVVQVVRQAMLKTQCIQNFGIAFVGLDQKAACGGVHDELAVASLMHVFQMTGDLDFAQIVVLPNKVRDDFV